MKKWLSLALIILVLPFSVAAQNIDPHASSTKSFIRHLKAQFFVDQKEKFNQQKESILERLRKYRFSKQQSQQSITDEPVLGGVMSQDKSTKTYEYSISEKTKLDSIRSKYNLDETWNHSQVKTWYITYLKNKIIVDDTPSKLSIITPESNDRYVSNQCKIISLCNGPIECVSKHLAIDNMAGTCEYRPEMDCYKQNFNRCERQDNGQCEWSLSNELQQCMAIATGGVSQNIYKQPVLPQLADDSCMDPNSNNPVCVANRQNTYTKPQIHPTFREPPLPPNIQSAQQTGNINLSKLQKKYPGSRMTYFVDKPFMGDTRKAPGSDEKAAQYKNTFWTKWMNRDGPSGTGDWEQYSDFQKLYPGVCKDKYPLDTECQTAQGSPYNINKQVIQRCSYGGFICENVAQQGGSCKDYKARFLCGGTPPEEEPDEPDERDPVTSSWKFESQTTYTPPEKPGEIPTKYNDTIKRDSDNATYQYGCSSSNINRICDRYKLETSYGKTDPYQTGDVLPDPSNDNNQQLGGTMPSGIMLPPLESPVTREDYIYSKQKFENESRQKKTLPQRVERYSSEDRHERLKRAQEILKTMRYQNR